MSLGLFAVIWGAVGLVVILLAWLWYVALKPRHAPSAPPGGELCEHFDHATNTPCGKPGTYELGETWLEHDGGTGMVATYCADHAPVGAVKVG